MGVKKFGDVRKDSIKSEVEMGTEINAAIGGRCHRRLPVVCETAVSFQTDETGSKGKATGKRKINTKGNQQTKKRDRILKIE